MSELLAEVFAPGVTIFTSWGQLAAAYACLILAATIYVLFGFGSGLIAIATLAVVFPDLTDAVVLILLINVPPELWVVFTTWRKIIVKGVVLICCGIALGVPVGTWILQSTDAVILLAILGGFLIVAGSGFLALPEARHIQSPTWLVPGVGMVSGVLGGMFGTGGPPLILYYRLSGVDKATFRGNLMAIFFVVSVARLVSYGFSGLLTAPRLLSAAMVLPAVLIGVFLGNRIQLAMSEGTFQRLVALALIVLGVALLARRLVA